MRIVLDIECGPRARKTIKAAMVGALVLTAGVALADPPKMFTSGETLTATDLNQNFTGLDGRLSALESSVFNENGALKGAKIYTTTVVHQLTGGGPTENFDIDISKAGFTARPTGIVVQSGGAATLLPSYVLSLTTPTTAVVQVAPLSGTVPAQPTRVDVIFMGI